MTTLRLVRLDTALRLEASPVLGPHRNAAVAKGAIRPGAEKYPQWEEEAARS